MMKNGSDTLKKILISCLEQKCRPEFYLGLDTEPGNAPDADYCDFEQGIHERLQKAVKFMLIESCGSSSQVTDFIPTLLKRYREDFFGLDGAGLAFLYEWGVSLSWLLFGRGSLSRRAWNVPQSLIKSGPVGANDLESVRIRFGWDTPETLWCFNWGSRQNNRSKSVLIRLLASLPVVHVMPEMPDMMELFHRLVTAIRQLPLDEIEAEDWLKEALGRMQKSPHLVRLLLLANQAQFSSWKLKSRQPKIYTFRIAYFLSRSLDAYGTSALLTYLRVLHAEALHLGFSGFDEVVREKTWLKTKKKNKA
ncbi:hypothetical protein [Desulfovibrio fairfieldensis]|uniref:Uncharacterized protein n=1 Tax=Desulfovibrio fairfieldensis TaxID=44742 RepID=A0A109W497_9BACT|nr:hypothetical protein [Desulfovibrio fairfieldensis]AMD90076.1 hypothetical protein AXF13_08055 [Desulfovibrio fairfieldensis]